MNSRKAPMLLAAVGVVVAVGLFLLLKDDTADEDTVRTDAPASQSAGGDSAGGGDRGTRGEGKPEDGNRDVTLIKIQDGRPVGGVKELEVPRGGEIRAFIVSDADDELHLHVYDVTLDLKAGETAKLSVPATIEGLFELESHTTGQLVAEISVVPS